MTPVTPEDLAAALRVLQAVADDPSLADGPGDAARLRTLVAKVHKAGKRAIREANHAEQVSADRAAAAQAAIVASRSPDPAPGDAPAEYRRARRCYVCKTPFTLVHHFYHLLCPACAALNWERRGRRADLRGRVALVTGGRVKIGHEVALKLLRDGARVVVTTRFLADAERRFRAAPDAGDWLSRLELVGLDLRDLPAVEAFAHALNRRESHLDILIHNAAQTIKRPLAFYRHLLETPAGTGALALSETPALLEARPGYLGHLPGLEAYFPPGALDRDGQQVDARPANSWRDALGQVGTVEAAEVFLVNALSPFVLDGVLLPALVRSPFERRFIVHVSAMEGQFDWAGKTHHHPHTNMAKAALNMLTRTVAADLARRGIYVNSVDTGWVTDEKPLPAAEAARERDGFFTPLDAIDGAARVYDPVAAGVGESGVPAFGQFLKDYAPYPW